MTILTTTEKSFEFLSIFAESSTALRNISARLVQQTLRTVSIVFLTLLDFVLRSYIRPVHSNRSNRSNLTLQCSLV